MVLAGITSIWVAGVFNLAKMVLMSDISILYIQYVMYSGVSAGVTSTTLPLVGIAAGVS
jgi:hypothetical protein